MIKKLIFIGMLFFSVLGFGQTMNFHWVKQISGTGFQTGSRLKIMPDGSVIAVGYFNSTTDFDPGPGVYPLNTTGALDVYVCKYDTSGNLIWARSMGGTQHDQPLGLDFDNNGNIYVSGSFESDSIDMDPGPLTYYLYQGNIPLTNGFLVKLDPSGNFLWAKSISSSYQSSFVRITVEGNAIYTTGYFSDTTDFDPGPATVSYIAHGMYHIADMFVAKYSTNGDLIWCKAMGGNGFETFLSVKYDNGHLLLGGQFSDTVDFDPGPGSFYQYSTSSFDGFLCKLDTSGNFTWAKSLGGVIWMGGAMFVLIRDIDVDNTGAIYMCGNFSGHLDADPGPGVITFSNNASSVFLIKLNPSGDLIFAKQFGESGFSVGAGELALDDYADIYVGGLYGNSFDVDPGPGTHYLNGPGGTNSFICRLDSSGNYIQAQRFINSVGMNQIADIAVGPDQSIYSTGDFENTTDFDPDLFMYDLTSSGNTDSYIHKMKTTHLSPSSLPVTENNHLQIYPNPTSEYIIVNSEYVLGGILIIYNKLGEKVYSATWLPGSVQMNLPVFSLSAGLYFITYMDAKGNNFTDKFIKE